MSKYAVIKVNNEQILVSEGDVFKINKSDNLNTEVLLYTAENQTLVGTPVVSGVKVTLEKLEDSRDRKISVNRFKAKSRYHKNKGHRQEVSTVKVTAITEAKTKTKKEEN
ncbi:50S ribosomal protein L21 [candidate division WWE3 bacterium]|uniref:Large ribosomal subunit protein bL21 n=1 Tax=candidate division WWE3 bacterium TaxID=2053526 RepID=A0A955EBW4_UNCKA|nr:50S ribosomal protein L21 [candidate division WWE3 bacterium]